MDDSREPEPEQFTQGSMWMENGTFIINVLEEENEDR
jgi:hypothetical protein